MECNVLLEQRFVPMVLIDIMKNGDKLDRVETKLFIYPLRKFGIGPQ